MDKVKLGKKLIIFGDIKFVNGVTRGLLCDLGKGNYELVPNGLIDFVNKFHGEKVSKIIETIEGEQGEVCKEYLDFLLNNNFAFLSDLGKQAFPRIENAWKSYSKVTNAVVDVDPERDLAQFDQLLYELEQLKCRHIEIRVLKNCSSKYLNELLDKFKDSSFRAVYLTIAYAIDLGNLDDLFDVYRRVCGITCFSKKIDRQVLPEAKFVKYLETDNINHSCGFVSSEYFNINIASYTEGLRFNSCLNGKVYVDLETGRIKNCPSALKVYGNYFESSIVQVLQKNEIKELWKMTKDEVNICSTCEFRRICSDCRVFVENPKDVNSKPLKCGYDPFSGTWENWSDNPLKYMVYEEICRTNL